jgi:hypothetical protein
MVPMVWSGGPGRDWSGEPVPGSLKVEVTSLHQRAVSKMNNTESTEGHRESPFILE